MIRNVLTRDEIDLLVNLCSETVTVHTISDDYQRCTVCGGYKVFVPFLSLTNGVETLQPYRPLPFPITSRFERDPLPVYFYW